MTRIIKTLELERYSKPDKFGESVKLGMVNAQDTFNKLYTHLEENKLLPDGYFLFNDEFRYYKGEIPIFKDVVCHTNFAKVKGINLDVFFRTGHGDVRLATGYTAKDSADDFFRMSRIAAECSLMLNGNGAAYFLSSDRNQKIELQFEQQIYSRKR